ncbi:MAG: hypothetical protein ABEJ99_01350 [Candidatus Nanohaloarchaea archaeon]
MPDRKKDLDTDEIVKLCEGTVKELREFLDDNLVSRDSLEELLEAEKNGKDRKTARKAIERALDHQQMDEDLAKVEEDVAEIESLLNEIDSTVERKDLPDKTDLDRKELLEIVGGTVSELKDRINSSNFSEDQLQEILETEEQLKDRKTAESFLGKKIEESEFEKDLEKAEDDLEGMKKEIKALEDESEGLESDEIEKAVDGIAKIDDEPDEGESSSVEETSAGETVDAQEKPDEDKEDIEGDDEEPEDEDREEKEDKDDYKKETEDTEDDEEADQDSSNDSEEVEENSEEEENEDKDSSEEGEGSDREDDEENQKEDELSEMEKKKDILEDLEVDLSDDELDEIPLEQLQSLKDEKKKRQRLINNLSSTFDEDMLRQASTADLEKLREEADIDEEPEKDDEEIRKEAQEDLKMLMGAVKDKEENEEDDEDEENDTGSLRSKITGILNRSDDENDEEEEDGFNDDKVLELLEEYRDLEGREAAIKVAHIMKGYLEYSEEIEREMTYSELADAVENEDGDSMDVLVKFFRRMHIDQYTGDIKTDDIENVINASEDVVKELS